MAKQLCKAQGKIQATKRWLNRAEEHFGRNAAVRGQMDLLLAEAELRSTRETVSKEPGRTSLNYLQQSIAFGLAAILVVAGMSGAWWLWRDGGSAEKLPKHGVVPSLSVVPAISAPVSDKSAAAETQPENAPATVVETTKPVQEVKKTEQSTVREPAASTVSEEEMKRLIQAAGQTLRGRTK